MNCRIIPVDRLSPAACARLNCGNPLSYMNWAVGLCVTGLALTIWGLRSREQWVWWTLLINGIGLFAGYSAPPLLLTQKPFSPVDLWGLSSLAVLNLLGLILARCPQWPLSRSMAHAPGS